VDADSHTHDPPTLRKIELQRLLHEYWDAHDVDEASATTRRIRPGTDPRSLSW
jgi:hypothetical protein